jgi:trk system potassium uptake protein TrkH
MRGRFAPFVLGIGLTGLAMIGFLFAAYAAGLREPAEGFLWLAAVAAALGLPLLRFNAVGAEPTRREALVGVLLLWSVLPAVGSLPYVVTGQMHPISALFESMSGYTATGATAMTEREFETFTESLFMYRAFSQWLGGVGIIVLFIAVFPQLAIAGRQLFFAELPGPTEERLTPRLRSTAAAVIAVYLTLTFTAIIAYVLAGLPLYDAIAHTFTTVSAAGFSPHTESLGGYGLAAAEWVAIFFMTVAGVSFILSYQALTGNLMPLWRDAELRVYLAIILGAATLMFFALEGVYDAPERVRHSLFQVISILTTTGYSSVDFAQWPDRAQALLVMLMFVGGSAGSAAGGIKIVRWLIVSKNTVRELQGALHPRAVMPLRIGSRIVPESVLRSVAAFITIYVAMFATLTVILVWLEADFVTAFSAAIACLGNVGPGLAGVGPMAHYDHLHPASRLLLTFAMFVGRLEVITVFVLFTPRFWHLPRWRARG